MEIIKNSKRFIKDCYAIAKYKTPAIRPLSINSKVRKKIEEFNENGFLKLECDRFFNVAKYLDDAYFKKIEEHNNVIVESDFRNSNRNFSIKELKKNKYVEGGMKISAYISLLDEQLSPLLFDDEIHSILYGYYKRQHYFRNQPRIMKVDYKGANKLNNGNMHVDHLHQVSIILNVSDISMNDTHTEYVPGSHKRSFLRHGIQMPVEKSMDLVKSYSDRVHFTGNKGTLYIFDTSGFHCGNYKQGNPRKIMHLNFTTGHHMTSVYDDPDDIKTYINNSNWPNYINNSLNKAIKFKPDY